MHVLEVLLRELKRLGRDVGDVFANQLARVDTGLVDLLQKERSEWLDTRPQEGTVERHVDALERNGREAALELDGAGLGFGLLGALLDDLDQMSLDVLDGQALCQLLNVDLLCLEVVGDVGEAVESAQVTSGDILHVGDVVVDNLEQPAGGLGDVLHDVLQSLLVEGLADTRWVDGAHAVIRAAGFVTLDCDLHSQTTVENDGDERFDGHDFGQGSESRILAERVSGESAVALNQALGAHVFERCLLHEGKGRLRELSGGQETSRRAVCVGCSGLIDVLEDLL